MNPFVQKIINEKKIRFNEGIFSVYHIPYIILPMNTFILFQKILEKEYGSETGEFIYQIAKRQGRTAVELQLKLSGYAKNLNTLRYQLQQCELMGLGNLEIARFDPKNKHVIIKNSNSPFCSQFVKLFGFQKEAVNHFLRGWCTGVAEAILDDTLKGEETDCIVTGKPYCLIKIEKTNKTKELDKLIDYKIINEKMGPKSLINSKVKIKRLKSPVAIIQRIIGHHSLKFENGEFKIWGMYAFMYPVNSSIFLYKTLKDRYGCYIDDLLYNLGKIQVENAIKIQKERFGVKNRTLLLHAVLQQSELLGLGESKLAEFNPRDDLLIVKNLNSPFCTQYSKLFNLSKKPVNYYWVGAVTGLGEGLFNKEAVGKERRCIAMGNPLCVVEVEGVNNPKSRQITKNLSDINFIKRYMSPSLLLAPSKG